MNSPARGWRLWGTFRSWYVLGMAGFGERTSTMLGIRLELGLTVPSPLSSGIFLCKITTKPLGKWRIRKRTVGEENLESRLSLFHC